MPKLLALDLDGTTFGEGTVLPAINRRRILEARERGTRICFVSGRKEAEPISHLFDLADYLVLNNGGTALEMPDCRELYTTLVKRADMLRMIDYCTENSVILHMFSPGYWGVNLVTPALAGIERSYGGRTVLYKTAADLPFETTDGFVASGDEAKLERAREFIAAEGLWLSCAVSEPESMDIMPGGIDKWKGVSFLAAREKIAVADVIAVGNYYNDREMIVGAGIGVAVQNAPDDLKALADYVTVRRHGEGAVAEVIEQFIL